MRISKRLFMIILSLMTFFILFGVCQLKILKTPSMKKIRIGMVIPMDHAALRDIVAGFKTAVLENAAFPVEIIVHNAQGDINLQRSLFQQFINQKMDLIVPVGTQATQMAVSMIKKQPIVSLAALFSETDRKKRNVVNLTGVHDEIEPQKQIKFIQTIFPSLKKITLLYSNSEKVFPEVEAIVKIAKTEGILLQKLMVQHLSELHQISRLIEKDSDVIFILKDHLIVSGIKTLVKEADIRRIPLVTSDEGSIREGGTFALGVSERGIGEQGGRMAVKVLLNKSISDFPMEEINQWTVFFNPKACLQKNVDRKTIEKEATQAGYTYHPTGQS